MPTGPRLLGHSLVRRRIAAGSLMRGLPVSRGRLLATGLRVAGRLISALIRPGLLLAGRRRERRLLAGGLVGALIRTGLLLVGGLLTRLLFATGLLMGRPRDQRARGWRRRPTGLGSRLGPGRTCGLRGGLFFGFAILAAAPALFLTGGIVAAAHEAAAFGCLVDLVVLGQVLDRSLVTDLRDIALRQPRRQHGEAVVVAAHRHASLTRVPRF
ncbi:hypothetical protein [Nocardia sp. NPDC058705]|uniref:hypothetical protein n=1 Tax=Nocardia sp. NPDC058705 TaxID=3346609 RepID=UPI0036B1BA37